MNGIIAVEKNLTGLMEELETEGYDVVALDDTNLEVADAIVVSGSDVNLMNMQDVLTSVPVINAAGKTAQEIIEELEKL